MSGVLESWKPFDQSQNGHPEDKMANEQGGSRDTQQVHAALVIQGCWRAHQNSARSKVRQHLTADMFSME